MMQIKSKMLRVKNNREFNKTRIGRLGVLAILLLSFVFAEAQEPTPAAPKSVTIPNVKTKVLQNGLTVAVIEKRNLPLVSVQFQTSQGSNGDYPFAGTANLMTQLLTKGTKTRTATRIAEEMEFLGGSIYAGAGFLNSQVSIGVTSDKLNQAMAIMSDVILNPAFKPSEIDLAKKQIVDDLTYRMTQPGSLANFAATTYSYNEWITLGTVDTVNKITRKEILKSYREQFKLQDATLVFTGDISAAQAFNLAHRLFGK
jgi:zinc protease